MCIPRRAAGSVLTGKVFGISKVLNLRFISATAWLCLFGWTFQLIFILGYGVRDLHALARCAVVVLGARCNSRLCSGLSRRLRRGIDAGPNRGVATRDGIDSCLPRQSTGPREPVRASGALSLTPWSSPRSIDSGASAGGGGVDVLSAVHDARGGRGVVARLCTVSAVDFDGVLNAGAVDGDGVVVVCRIGVIGADVIVLVFVVVMVLCVAGRRLADPEFVDGIFECDAMHFRGAVP